jgi:protein-S-isoprenylcysteine O-methyltransferase Ste14
MNTASLLLLLTYSALSDAFVSPHFQLRPTPEPLSSRHSTSSRANLFAKDFFHLHAQTEDDKHSKDHTEVKVHTDAVDAVEVDVDVDVDEEIVSYASDMRTQEQEQINGSTDSFERSTSAYDSHSAEISLSNSKQSIQNLNSNSSSTAEQIQQYTNQTKAFLSNIFNSQFGKRGEPFLALQILLLFSIAFGRVPLLQDFMRVMLGPGMFLVGLGVSFAAVRQMNLHSPQSFTLFLQPRSGSESGTGLVDRGIFRFVRHPFYAGNLATLLGWSVISGSVMRMFLTLTYYKVVEKMVVSEEKELEVAFGEEFGDYKKRVQDKFLPMKALNSAMERCRKSSRRDKSTRTTKNDVHVEMTDEPKKASCNVSKMIDLGFSVDETIAQRESKTESDGSEVKSKSEESTRKQIKNPNGLFP